MNNYYIKPGTKIKLSDFDPEDKSQFSENKQEAEQRMIEFGQELDKLQDVLYAQHLHKVLIVFQALDTGGKDGVIRSVFSGINPEGVHIANFKIPTSEELDHDFLWRVHSQVPGKGELVVFNRSHYEDVLVVRVHNLITKPVWQERYTQINNFEKMLVDEGTTVLKFYLNITKDEQKKRLQARLDNPDKNWKFNSADLDERAFWDNYMDAYQEAISETSTDWAPWYVIPSNHNWYRNLCVISIIVKTLDDLKMKYPDPLPGLDKIVIK